MNGELAHRQSLDVDPAALQDFDGTIELDMPSRDSWVVVTALGRGERHWMRPVYLDVPFGELQLPQVAAMAFSNVPLVSTVFPTPVRFPDFYPVRPYAIANAVLLDADGDGAFTPPNPRPAFCSPKCDPETGLMADGKGCDTLQSTYTCLKPEGRCGVDIPGVCDIYQALQQGALRSTLGAHSATP